MKDLGGFLARFSKDDLEILVKELGYENAGDLLEELSGGAGDSIKEVKSAMERLGMRSPGSSGGSASSAGYVGSAAGSSGDVTNTPEVLRRFSELVKRIRGPRGYVLKVEGHLPRWIFEPIASLVSNYSLHLGKRTVAFDGGKLSINERGASGDRAKDSEGDKCLSETLSDLRREILNKAKFCGSEEYKETFIILAALFNKLNTLSPDLCNQQNAIELAEFLKSHAPQPGYDKSGVERSVQAGCRYESPPPGKRSERRR